MYPIALGANHMRSKVTLPDHVHCFPEYLRQAGYYCTNNSKTDYNFHWKPQDVWDQTSRKAHWKNRPHEDQPFFAVFNLTMTHESRVWPQNWKRVTASLPLDHFHDPSTVQVPELYPDTPAVRGAIARLHDLITVMDTRVGDLLAELDGAGLTDSTIVVFWSDHGDGLPRAKRWVYDSGTRVPMIARIPERFRVDGQAEPDRVDDQLVNLIDLAPTTLNLAGLEVPEHMHGRAFLGRDLSVPREYIFGARDRIDERFDMVRSVRDGCYRYVRNFMTWLPMLQHINYSERSMIRQELRRLMHSGELPPTQARLFTVPRPRDELYDLEKDPFELNNLADHPDYREELARLQRVCDGWQSDVRDAHVIPESLLVAEERSTLSRWHVFHRPDQQERWEAVFHSAAQPVSVSPTGISLSSDPAMRWWQLVRLRVENTDPAALAQRTAGLRDRSEAVRIAAARSLWVFDPSRPAVLECLGELLQSDDAFIRHAALLTADELDGAAKQLSDSIRTMQSTNHFLARYLQTVSTHALSQE